MKFILGKTKRGTGFYSESPTQLHKRTLTRLRVAFFSLHQLSWAPNGENSHTAAPSEGLSVNHGSLSNQSLLELNNLFIRQGVPCGCSGLLTSSCHCASQLYLTGHFIWGISSPRVHPERNYWVWWNELLTLTECAWYGESSSRDERKA